MTQRVRRRDRKQRQSADEAVWQHLGDAWNRIGGAADRLDATLQRALDAMNNAKRVLAEYGAAEASTSDLVSPGYCGSVQTDIDNAESLPPEDRSIEIPEF